MTEAKRIPYVFILAASHSGSTLTAMLLNSHREVTTIGEMTSGAYRPLDGYRCSCRSLLTECRFWRAVSANMRRDHPEFNLADFGIRFELQEPAWLHRVLRAEHRGRLLEACRDAALALSPTWRRHFSRTASTCAAFAREVLRESGARVLVDSSKLAHRLKFVLQVPELDVRVIHVVRDGRAVALTYMDSDNFADARDPGLRRGGRGSASPQFVPQLTMDEAADEWRRSIRSAEHVLAGLDASRWMRIRYEDLCERPSATLGRVFSFLGLDPANRVDRFRDAPNHVVGNGMRMDADSEIRLDERWKEVLSAADLATFERIAGDLNRKYARPAAPAEPPARDRRVS